MLVGEGSVANGRSARLESKEIEPLLLATSRAARNIEQEGIGKKKKLKKRTRKKWGGAFSGVQEHHIKIIMMASGLRVTSNSIARVKSFSIPDVSIQIRTASSKFLPCDKKKKKKKKF